MSSVRWFALIAALLIAAVVISGFLYGRSRSADFNRHAQAIEAIGKVRHLQEHLSQQVLAARFGLLNQYDPITSAELGLTAAGAGLNERLGAAVRSEGELEQAIAELEKSIERQRTAAEHFKTENSVLKNSLYYLPSAAQEADLGLVELGTAKAAERTELSKAIDQLAKATLVYNLIGDASAQATHARAIADLEARAEGIPSSGRSRLHVLLAHAHVIGRKQPAVDGWVKKVVESDIRQRLEAVERIYNRRFNESVETSNGYRKILYGWSLVLVIAIGIAGLQLLRLYTGLERRVAQRTQELRQAMDALWGEMRLARKIQEALVPAAPSGQNCEIAASMRPTTEVGGDYYDVLQCRGRDWILIGDVSGHGVPAGLIMMMCHTAVRTVLGQNPDILPDKLLSIVNKVLTQNIRQLGEDKYMTISAFRRDADGTVLFAGAHQDIHIYRADTDSVETLETEGIWLGIKDEIDEALVTRRFSLRPGDMFLLYTDGITEAKRDGALFDTSGVNEVLQRARGKTADEVLADLFAELDDFKINDDASVLIVKQLDSDRVPEHSSQSELVLPG